MKTSTLICVAFVVAMIIALPTFIVACTSGYKIVKYSAVKTAFEKTIVNNLDLCGQDEKLFENQDRGFRGEVYITLGTEWGYPKKDQGSYLDSLNGQIDLYSEDNMNIVQCYVYLTEYNTKDLDGKALNQLKEYFELLKSKNLRILLRFAYEYTDSENHDAKDSQIIRHLDQIGDFIQANNVLFHDVVYAMQLGLIGLWGEGHGNHINHNVRKLAVKLADIIPHDIYIMVRTPAFLSQIPKSIEHRFSIHDDFLVGVDHEWGLMPWTDPQYQDVLNKNQYAIADGEMPWGDYKENDELYLIDGKNLVKQVVGYGFTTMSITHNYKEDRGEENAQHLENWKSEYLTKDWLESNHIPYLPTMLDDEEKISVYKYLQYHLGYNLGLSNLEKKSNSVSFMVNNFGMAAPFEYQLQVMYDGKVMYVEPKLLTRFEQQVITINSNNVKQIKVRFIHKRTGSTIKLANNLPYENGWNVIDVDKYYKN